MVNSKFSLEVCAQGGIKIGQSKSLVKKFSRSQCIQEPVIFLSAGSNDILSRNFSDCTLVLFRSLVALLRRKFQPRHSLVLKVPLFPKLANAAVLVDRFIDLILLFLHAKVRLFNRLISLE